MYVLSILAAAAAVFWLAGCRQEPVPVALSAVANRTISADEQGTSLKGLERIQSNGVLVVGTAITEPFEYHDPQTDELMGFDVDIARRIAQRLGVELQWVEMPFANLIPALQDHKVDMTIAAMYINPEREEQVDFAEPYVDTGLVMVAQPDIVSRLHSTDDLTALKVGVKIGSTGAKLAQDLRGNGIELTIVEYKDTLDSLLNLEVGRIDVVFNDYLNTLVYLKDSGSSLEIVQDESGQILFLSWVGLGIAVPQGESELLDFINQALTEMREDGSLEQYHDTWLASGAAQ